MSTVVRRCFPSTPARDAHATWKAIVDLLMRGKAGDNRDELMRVAGVAASVITDQAPKDAPIIVTCDGPRTRIYCLYDEDAIDGSDSNEEALGFDPLAGDWAISLPCHADDLSWVSAALAEESKRVTARDQSEGISKSETAAAAAGGGLVFNAEGFLKP
jgi:hypothetical protein